MEETSDVVIEPDGARRVWVRSYLGLLYSSDGGVTWTQTLPFTFGEFGYRTDGNVQDVVLDPSDSNVIYTILRSEIWRSNDQGANWTVVATITDAGVGNAIDVHPTLATNLFVGGSRGIVYSDNSGGTWQSRNTGLHAGSARVLMPAAASGRVYISAESSLGIHYLEPGASITQPVNNAALIAYSPVSLWQHPFYVHSSSAGDRLWVKLASSGLNTSSDGGNTWSPASALPSNLGMLTLSGSPIDPQVLYAGTGSKVSKSIDGGVTWVPSGTGIPSSSGTSFQGSVYSIAVSATNPSVLYAATGDGVFKSSNAAQNWQRASSGGRGTAWSRPTIRADRALGQRSRFLQEQRRGNHLERHGGRRYSCVPG